MALRVSLRLRDDMLVHANCELCFQVGRFLYV